MGVQFSPLLNVPIPDWQELPDVPLWMMNGAQQMERHGVIPVADATAREALIPSANRWKGQLTYNAATDTFEYWNGSTWRRMNLHQDMPSVSVGAWSTDITLKPGAHVDFTVTLTATVACQMIGWNRASLLVNATPSTWQSCYLSNIHDSTISGWTARGVVMYPAKSGGGACDLTTFMKVSLTPGTHKIGFRVSTGSGSLSAILSYAEHVAIQGANKSSGGGAYGDW